jgi:hypothetical protein
VVAVGRHQLGPERHFAPARGEEVDQLRAVGAALALQRLVEGDRQPADRLSVLAAAKARRDRQIGDQIHHDDRPRLAAQASEDHLEILLVCGQRHLGGDVVRPDRQRDQVGAQLDRTVELARAHVGRGRAAHAQVGDARCRIDGAQALVQTAHVIAGAARGTDALDGAVAERHVDDRRAALGGKHSRAGGVGRRGPDVGRAIGDARRRRQERDDE